MTDETPTDTAKTGSQLRSEIADYEKRIEEVAELVAHVRHEINNPLTAMLGQAQLLLREDLSEKARKRVQTIEELAIRMRDLVAELRLVQKPVNHAVTDLSGDT
jgi:signal transduction histidine kinase